MVQRMQEIVAKYEDRLRQMQSVPRLSYGRRLVCTDGAPNRIHTYMYFHSPSSIKHDCIRTWNTPVYQYIIRKSNAHCSLSEFTNLQNLYQILNIYDID